MLGIVILNVVFCAFVIVGILGLLAWGIVSDRTMPVHTQRHARVQQPRAARRQVGLPARASQLTA